LPRLFQRTFFIVPSRVFLPRFLYFVSTLFFAFFLLTDAPPANCWTLYPAFAFVSSGLFWGQLTLGFFFHRCLFLSCSCFSRFAANVFLPRRPLSFTSDGLHPYPSPRCGPFPPIYWTVNRVCLRDELAFVKLCFQSCAVPFHSLVSNPPNGFTPVPPVQPDKSTPPTGPRSFRPFRSFVHTHILTPVLVPLSFAFPEVP